MAAPLLIVDLANQAATESLAAKIAPLVAVGDTIALSGGLGAGKTTFARALIRTLAGDDRLEVPSPTFTLVQTYQTPRLTLTHVDLYRLTDPREIEETGFFDALVDGAVVVEWPERAGRSLPAERLDVALEMAGGARRARISGGRAWASRLAGIG